jgi:hypothetical protein
MTIQTTKETTMPEVVSIMVGAISMEGSIPLGDGEGGDRRS